MPGCGAQTACSTREGGFSGNRRTEDNRMIADSSARIR